MKNIAPISVFCLLVVGVTVLPFDLRTLPAQEVGVGRDTDELRMTFSELEIEFAMSIRPLIKRYCGDCHNSEEVEGELDLLQFEDFQRARDFPALWQQVLVNIENGEMPPEGASTLPVSGGDAIVKWINAYLDATALASAGDPGPVVLRRLSNAEYDYTIEDLTGLSGLNLTAEFPIDGAAGEGFMNVGAGLVMSPSLLTKYLQAAKQVAQHVVLLPDGISFSQHLSQRDRTEEKLAEIRAFYSRFTVPGDASAHNLQGVVFTTRDGGVVPLEDYLKATIYAREALKTGNVTISDIAKLRNLNARYLRILWESLTADRSSLVLDVICEQWRHADDNNSDQLVDLISRWQRVLWRFSTVGHIGKSNGPKKWQEPLEPLVESQVVRASLDSSCIVKGPRGESQIPLHLVTSGLGDSRADDVVLWNNAMLRFDRGTTIPLQEADRLAAEISELQKAELARTSEYLNALSIATQRHQSIAQVAGELGLDPTLLDAWGRLLRVADYQSVVLTGRFQEKLERVAGYSEVNGWGYHQTPSIIANRSPETVRFSTLTLGPRSVLVHPSPSKQVVVCWQSPISGEIEIQGSLKDSDANCGNGVEWSIDVYRGLGQSSKVLASGAIDNGGSGAFVVDGKIKIGRGDVIGLAIAPRGSDHACDTTTIELDIKEVASKQGELPLIWNLTDEVVDRLLLSNPLSDKLGNTNVWHFCSSQNDQNKAAEVPLSVVLGKWLESLASQAPKADLDRNATLVESQLVAALKGEAISGSAADKQFVDSLIDWSGPLDWLRIGASRISHVVSQIRTEPGVITYWLDKRFVGGQFTADVQLDPERGREGCAQVRVQCTPPDATVSLHPSTVTGLERRAMWTGTESIAGWDSPILVNEGSSSAARIRAELTEFRELFPAAMCYTQIVPVDEVVTLTLYHREDDCLQRLMLDQNETEELDRLWDELHYVSRDALKLVDAFEQLYQFATQDADPSVFDQLRLPIQQRAERFKEELIRSEPEHVASLQRFARRAWRRFDQSHLDRVVGGFYSRARNEGMEHEAAMQLALVRVLLAPEFLYKIEIPGAGESTSPVSEAELASRLSFFLWSSVPDQHLETALFDAERIKNTSREHVITEQTRRMLKDPKIRRLAVEFACQWLGVRDFHELDEKSSESFPEFNSLKHSMREEAVLFFTDLFQNDRSILSILDAEYTFTDGILRDFYGLSDLRSTESENGWLRVDGIREHGRGGVLGMAATLARQSGASRTSPILRGNWVYEVLLGEHLPRPPKNVPVLPEIVPAGLTERQLIEMHSQDPACAKCHDKIDGFGFALEGFDAIGRARIGIDTATKLPDGTTIDGLDGLREYLIKARKRDFARQFCRKLLGYALGRSVGLSEQPLLDSMLSELESNEYRVSIAVERVVTSPQFTQIRGRAAFGIEPRKDDTIE